MTRFNFILVCVFVYVFGVVQCKTSRTIPPHLRPCYTTGVPPSSPPLSLPLLVEILAKVEQSNPTQGLRVMGLSLLHSLRLDGIERAPNLQESEFVLPYRASAFQYSKYSFLLDYMLPFGEVDVTMWGSLSQGELCGLHGMLSAGVEPWERGDEGRVCPIRGPNQKGTQKTHNGFVVTSSTTKKVNRTIVPSSYSRCPVEKGVVKTPWGNISPGSVIAGVCAALEPQNVRLHEIYRAAEAVREDEAVMGDDEAVNRIAQQMDEIDEIETQWKKALMSSENAISNKMAATITGDIAEMVIRQGPTLKSYQLGGAGRWNDSALPRRLLLMEPNDGHWEVTDAEILGGIDGYIIANHVKEWMGKLDRLRLSQILEMYYSVEGVAFNKSVRACRRKELVEEAWREVDLGQQTLDLVNVLWMALGNVYVTPERMEDMTRQGVDAFHKYWRALVDSQPGCDVQRISSPMGAMLVTDGSWTKYQTEQLISILSESLDVSSYGSSLGVLHGNTGEWLAMPSHSVQDVFDSVNNYTDRWVERLNLPNVLTTIVQYFENTTEIESEKYLVGGLPNVIIIAAPSTRISEMELNRSRTILESIRTSYPDVYILYITPEEREFKYLSIDNKQYSEMHIQSSNTNVKDFAEMIRVNFVEKTIPKRLVEPLCGSVRPTNRRVQFEDYIKVGHKIVYRIHPIFYLYASHIKVEFQGVEQGDLTVCLSGSSSSESVGTSTLTTSCKVLGGGEMVSFFLRNPCGGAAFCEPLYFTVTARETLNRCGDMDCRYPDQIRFYVRHSGLQCRINKKDNNTNNGGYSTSTNLLRNVIILEIIYLLSAIYL